MYTGESVKANRLRIPRTLYTAELIKEAYYENN